MLKVMLFLFPMLLLLVPLVPVEASHAEPFQATYTISEYYSFNLIDKATQEAAVHNAVTAWTEHLNAEAVFVPNAEKKDVFCWVEFTQLSEIGAGGGRPGFFCQAQVGSNQRLYVGEKPPFDRFIWRNAEVILQHEIGHGFGLGHYGNAGCQMFASYGGSPNRHCDQELDRLKMLWANVEPWPPVIIYDGAMKSFSAPSTVVKGDKVVLDFTIENVGTFFYYNVVWFYDWTDNKVIQSGPFHELGAGETFSSTVIWDTSLVSTGEHKIRGCWIATNNSANPEFNDVDWSNNCIDIFIDVTDTTLPPPPEPVPEPIPEPPQFTTSVLDSVIALSQTSIFIEWHNQITPDGGFDIFIDDFDTNTQWRTTNLFQTVTGLQPDTEYCIKIQNRYITPIRTFPESNELCTITDPIPPPSPPPQPDPVDYFESFIETVTISDSIQVTHIKGEKPLPTFEELVEWVRELRNLHGIE